MPDVSGLHKMLNLIKYISKQFDAYGEHPRYIHLNLIIVSKIICLRQIQTKNPLRHHDEVEKYKLKYKKHYGKKILVNF